MLHAIIVTVLTLVSLAAAGHAIVTMNLLTGFIAVVSLFALGVLSLLDEMLDRLRTIENDIKLLVHAPPREAPMTRPPMQG